jgi:predicted nucleic acid-binding protein
MIPVRLVVDTNTAVSAALKPGGLQRTVLLLAVSKPARLYVSEAVMAEYREVLARPKIIFEGVYSSNCSSSSAAIPIPSNPRVRCT